jgi:hypothetical protein
MVDARLTFTRDELLGTQPALGPLVTGGVRCHGGFQADGTYCSPRALHRMPAIRAWQARLIAEGHELLAIAPPLIPPQYPSLEQAKLLLSEGVREPIVRALTMISIVEGFGAVIRDVAVPDLSAVVVEPVEGTALAHLGVGLFEAHARDEAGHKDEGGHKQMWEAARDLALDKPKVPGDILMRFMGRRTANDGAARERLEPAIDPVLERMLVTMANVLVIEVFAARTFDWGERLLSDPTVSADPVGAGAMVGYVRTDETPHVEYLRTALSELRARTLRTTTGGLVSGRRVVDALLHRTLAALTTSRPRDQRENVRGGLVTAIREARKGDSLIEQFDALAPAWVPPATTGFEAVELRS